jgi:molecular chaperone DnaK
MGNALAIGIDLGTTFSAAAIVNQHGQPEILPNSEGERITPSAVFFDNDSIVVGQIAKDAAVSCPDQVVTFVKRQMGSPNWYYLHNQQRLYPPDISALILAKMKKDVEEALGQPVAYAVITVPAYFDDDRRRATLTAGELAGFKVLGLLNEPSAAAIAFGVERSSQKETVLVYDLGGGTFDVTLMRVEGKDITILTTDGDHQLGGKDFDDLIIKYAVEKFIQEHGFDPTNDPYTAQEIRKDAEKLKRELSTRSKGFIMLRSQGKTSRVELERRVFEDLMKAKLGITLSLVKTVLADAKTSAAQVDRVLLIGGSTRIPAVRTLLAEFFGKEPDSSINPDEAVAQGAALMAAKKVLEIKPEEVAPLVQEKVGGLNITDVTSHSLGIEAYIPGTQQKINAILIQRNSPIPADISKEFVTTMPGQTGIQVTIYQGEFRDPAMCNPIGEFLLTGLPPNRPAGCKVRVTILCGVNGVVDVSAVDIESGQRIQTQVSYKVGQTSEQVSAKKRWMQTQKVE